MSKFTRKDILHVAKLAHLEISEAEIPARLEEFNQIVSYIEKLGQLPTQGIEPTTQVVPNAESVGTPMLADQPVPSFTTEKVIQNAPDRQDHFFRVPRMIGEEV